MILRLCLTEVQKENQRLYGADELPSAAVFWTAVHEGSISNASEKRWIPSPAISAPLRSFEENFGQTLLSTFWVQPRAD